MRFLSVLLTKKKDMPHCRTQRRKSGLFFKALSAGGAGNANPSLSARDADLLPASRAGEITVTPVLEAIEEGEEFLILRAPLVEISGVHSKDRVNQRYVSKKTQPVELAEAPEQSEDYADNQQEHRELVAAIASIHESAKAVTQFSEHNTVTNLKNAA